MSKDMDFYHSQNICLTKMENNYWILLLKQDALDALKICFQKSNP